MNWMLHFYWVLWRWSSYFLECPPGELWMTRLRLDLLPGSFGFSTLSSTLSWSSTLSGSSWTSEDLRGLSIIPLDILAVCWQFILLARYWFWFWASTNPPRYLYKRNRVSHYALVTSYIVIATQSMRQNQSMQKVREKVWLQTHATTEWQVGTARKCSYKKKQVQFHLVLPVDQHGLALFSTLN